MFFNLLARTEDPTRSVSVAESALYALLGFIVVFIGIAFLIAVVWLVGKVMSNNKTVSVSQKAPKQTVTVAESIAVADAETEEVSEETLAVIMAALMAYYQTNNPKCEFTVKRIKRI